MIGPPLTVAAPTRRGDPPSHAATGRSEGLLAAQHGNFTCRLVRQDSRKACAHGISFGCIMHTNSMWVEGCRGAFHCGAAQPVFCGHMTVSEPFRNSCIHPHPFCSLWCPDRNAHYKPGIVTPPGTPRAASTTAARAFLQQTPCCPLPSSRHHCSKSLVLLGSMWPWLALTIRCLSIALA